MPKGNFLRKSLRKITIFVKYVLRSEGKSMHEAGRPNIFSILSHIIRPSGLKRSSLCPIFVRKKNLKERIFQGCTMSVLECAGLPYNVRKSLYK